MNHVHQAAMAKAAACIAITFSAALVASGVPAQEAPVEEAPAFVAPDQETLDAQFAQQLSGSTLVGQFTVDARQGDDPLRPRTERYELIEVRKLRGALWLFRSRIQYGEHDVTLPITLPVQWAGDTPVIIVDNVGFPGLGTYSARVMFHGDRYVGTWQGANHGGHMFGRIEREETTPPADDPEQTPPPAPQ